MSITKTTTLTRIQAAQRRHKTAFSISMALGLLTLIAGFAVWRTGNDAQDAVQDEATARIIATDAKANAAHDRADESERELKKLQRQIDNRLLSATQFATISQTLRSFPARRAQVICTAGYPEAYAYAKQIARAVEAAHWDTGAGTVQKPETLPEFGILIAVREEDREAGTQLMQALARASIPSRINATKAALSGIVQVYVGPKQ